MHVVCVWPVLFDFSCTDKNRLGNGKEGLKCSKSGFMSERFGR